MKLLQLLIQSHIQIVGPNSVLFWTQYNITQTKLGLIKYNNKVGVSDEGTFCSVQELEMDKMTICMHVVPGAGASPMMTMAPCGTILVACYY